MTASISIKTPDFALEAPVWLHFGGATIPTSIKVRAYFPDKGYWQYRVALSGQWHPLSELSARPE